MKKRLFFITAAALLALNSCVSTQMVDTFTNSSYETDEIDSYITANEDNKDVYPKGIDEKSDRPVEISKEKSGEIAVNKPLFDASKFANISVPRVIDAEKKTEDKLFDKGYEFRYIVQIPKINSEKPGALNLNQKIYSEYEKLLDFDEYMERGGATSNHL